MRVIVCGSRDFDAWHALDEELQSLCQSWRHEPVVIVHGAARGADALAQTFVDDGRAHRDPFREGTVTAEAHPALWDTEGKAAGPKRNIRMAKAGANLCVAFWDGNSPGTGHMIATATRHGIPVRIVPWRNLRA